MIDKIRAYFSDPAHKKLIAFFAIIAIVIAVPATVLLSQQKQTLRQHASELPSPVPSAIQASAAKDVEEIGQLTNQLLQFNKSRSLGPEPLSESAQKTKDRITKDAIEIAKKRKGLLLKLAEKNPRLFLTIALKKNIQSSMSVDIQSYLEKEVTVEGKIEVFHVDDFKTPSNSKFSYFLKIGNEKISLFLTQKLFIASGAKIKVKGIRLDSAIAATTDKTSFQILEPALKPESVGDQKTLVLLIRFQDSGSEPFTKEKAYDLIFNNQTQKFYKEQSYSQVSFSGDVFGWFTLGVNNPGDACAILTGSNDNFSKLVSDNSIDLGSYGRVVFAVDTYAGGCSSVGKYENTINSKTYRFSEAALGVWNHTNAWSNYSFQWTLFDFILSHELGHSLGVLHANGWDCKDQTLYGECTHIEYGNFFDTMGEGFLSLHFNAYYKELLGWISSSSALLINTSGTYTINPLELNSNTKLAKIKIHGLDIVPFSLEYRKGIGFDANLNNSALLSNQSGLFVNYITNSYLDERSTRLLDMTPASLYWNDDIQQTTLNGENIFTDEGTGITIGPIMKADDSSITFDVKLTNPICTTRQPLLSSNYYSESVAAGGQGWAAIGFTNRDSLACGDSEFKIVPILPPGWSYSLDPAENIIAAPDQQVFANLNFTVPENAALGSTLLDYDIINTKSGLKAHSKLNIIIKPPAKITKIDPQAGTIGTKISIFGSGFDAIPSKNTIIFYSYNSKDSYSYIETASEVSQIQGEQVLKLTVPNTITYCASSGGTDAPLIQGGGGGGGGGDPACSEIPTPLGIYSIIIYVEGLNTSNAIDFEITAAPTPTPSSNLPCGTIGDVHEDGKIGIADSQKILQYIVGNRTFTDDEKKRADVNGDGKISTVDSILIQRYIVKIITTFPACPKQ